MYKYNKGIIPKALTELFTLNSSNHSYNTRNKDKIRSAYGNPCIRILNLPVFISGIILPAIIINTSFIDFENKSIFI